MNTDKILFNAILIKGSGRQKKFTVFFTVSEKMIINIFSKIDKLL